MAIDWTKIGSGSDVTVGQAASGNYTPSEASQAYIDQRSDTVSSIADLYDSGYNADFNANSISAEDFTAVSGLGTGGKWGNVTYADALAKAKSTGDWTQVGSMLEFAQNNPRERSGAFGTGIDLMPHSFLGAAGMFAGAAAGLGAFKGFGLPGVVPGSGTAGSANSLAVAGGGTTGATGASTLNAATTAAQTGVAAGTSSLSTAASGVGSAAANIGANTAAGVGAATVATAAANPLATIKTAVSAISTGKNLIGGLLDLKAGFDAKSDAANLAEAGGPDPQTERVRAQLEQFLNDPSTADVDQRWLDQLAQDYTRTASAKHGVDSGAYIEGLISVLNRGRMDWLESREGAGRGLLSSANTISNSEFGRQESINEQNAFANAMVSGGAATVASSALDFVFDLFD